MKISKLVCDFCGKEKDLLNPICMIGYGDQWQTLLDDMNNEIHLCSNECIINYLNKEKGE